MWKVFYIPIYFKTKRGKPMNQEEKGLISYHSRNIFLFPYPKYFCRMLSWWLLLVKF